MNSINSKLASFERSAIPMSGFNSYSNYAYATDLDVQSVVDKFNRENGLFLTYTVVRYEITYVGDKVAATVEVRAKLVSESNEYIESFAPGYGLSKDDKAVYKAITGAKKYATRLLYGLASEPKDEPESESPEVKTKRSFTLKENSDV